MKKTFCSLRFLFGAALCLFITVPGFVTDASAAAAAKKDTVQASAKATESPEVLQKKLLEFGESVAASFNRCVMPSEAKKKVEKNADGTYTATYVGIDPKSLSASYKQAIDPKSPVKYIGTLNYDEVTYTCTAKTKADAGKGPFKNARVRTTELVKYVNGKWTY